MVKVFYLCNLIVLLLAMAPSACAGKVELTTYYPMPYAEYRELRVKQNAYFVTTSGAMGIGTTNPLFQVHNMPSGQTGEPSAILNTAEEFASTIATQGSGLAYLHARDVSFNIEFMMGISGIGVAFAGSMTADDFQLRTNNVAKMTIQDSTGNVGIGTTNPVAKLQISGTMTNTNSRPLYVQGSSGDRHTAAFVNPAGYGVAVGAQDSATVGNIWAARFENGAGVENRPLVLNPDPTGGNVGIITLTPGAKLDISGGNGRVGSGYNWLRTSDARLKKNITPLNGSLEKVTAVRGVRFDLIEEDTSTPGKGRYIGFIAQELEKEFPELVVTDKKGLKAVAYDKMTAVLVEAVKEQERKIQKRQQQIDFLKKEVEKLQRKNPAS
ncbi:MAG: tail fiber domain-containing protein [Candidatus Omnitrophota bacterium]